MRIKGVTSFVNPENDKVEDVPFFGSSVQSIEKQVDDFFSLQPDINEYSTEYTILATKVKK